VSLPVRSVLRLVVASLAPALLVLVAACDASSTSGDADPPEVSVRLGFTQLLPKAGTRDAMLRVVNTGEKDLFVTGAGLAWSGYGAEFSAPQDIVIPAGDTRDLRLRLPPPRCGDVDAQVRATVSVAGGSVTQRLTRYGEVFVRRLWERQCGERLVRRTVQVEYGDRWTQAGPRSAPVAAGTIRLTRVGGSEDVEVTSVDGSVLHGLRLPAPAALLGDAASVELPLHVVPGNRCDEHARGQATAPYDFLLQLRIGDVTEVTVAPEVPLVVQEAATRALDRSCGGPVRTVD